MKARLKGAQTGRNLLKKKSDALTLRFRQILKKIIEVERILLRTVYILEIPKESLAWLWAFFL